MADEPSSDRRGRSDDPPWEVEITILPLPRPPIRERLRHARVRRRHLVVLMMLILLATPPAVGVLLAAGPGPAAPHRHRDVLARRPGAFGVAAAYGYPVRCLSVDFAPGDRAYARADFDRRLPCGRFAGDPTAVFHRTAGVWRSVLDAVTYTCPVRSLPARVQTELSVCPAATG